MFLLSDNITNTLIKQDIVSHVLELHNVERVGWVEYSHMSHILKRRSKKNSVYQLCLSRFKIVKLVLYNCQFKEI